VMANSTNIRRCDSGRRCIRLVYNTSDLFVYKGKKEWVSYAEAVLNLPFELGN
jgi:hypothetical protein